MQVRSFEPAPTRLDAESLTVATYNVRGCHNAAGVRRDMMALSDVAVWCLQEVRQGPGSDISGILPPGPWHVAILPLNRIAADAEEWESQVIASRFPLDRVEVWLLADRGAKRRVALGARLEVDGRGVFVVNTDHEPSFLAWRDGNLDQARRLARYLDACDEDFVVVAGDFNCAGNLFRLRGNGAHIRTVDDTFARAGFAPSVPTGSTFRSGLIRSRLDRIYTRGLRPVTAAIAKRSQGSDHLPVWGRFRFSGVATPSRPPGSQ